MPARRALWIGAETGGLLRLKDGASSSYTVTNGLSSYRFRNNDGIWNETGAMLRPTTVFFSAQEDCVG